MRLFVVSMVVPVLALAEGVPALSVVKVQPVRSTSQEVVTGSLFPSRMLPMGFEVGGRLAVSKAVKGEVVKAGQLLGALDQEIVDAQVAQAEAQVSAAEAAAGLASDVAGRTDRLKAEGSVSDVQSKQTGMQAQAAKAQWLQAKAGLAQARAAKRRHTLFAPFSGTLIDAPDQVGGMVAPGMPVYIVMQLDPLVLKATIPEALHAVVKPGLAVKVESVAAAVSADDAVVKVVLASADPQSRRVPIEVTVPNRDGRFVANTLAKVTLPVGESRSAYVVPTTALGTSGGDHVFAIDGAGRLKRVSVTVSDRTPQQVTVVAGEPLTEVVDHPTSALADGATFTRR